MPNLPVSVSTFQNASGSISYRVQGYVRGERIRKNFAEREEAQKTCDEKNALALGDSLKDSQTWRRTRLTEEDIIAAETGLNQAQGQWPLSAIMRAGIASLQATPDAKAVAPLAETWLDLIELEVGKLRFQELNQKVRAFTRAYPALTTDQFNRQTVRKYLDGLKQAPQTKANTRNALHRWCGWLVECGELKENPASGVRISRGRLSDGDEAGIMPLVFSLRRLNAGCAPWPKSTVACWAGPSFALSAG